MGRTESTAAGIAPEIEAVLTDAPELRIVLHADQGNKLRWRPRSAMTPDLTDRPKVKKLALPGRRDTADKTPTPCESIRSHHAQSEVLSVVSVSERGTRLESEDELALPAGAGTARTWPQRRAATSLATYYTVSA